MLDTLSVAEQLAAGGVARDQAKVIARAIHDGLRQGGHVTTDQLEAGLAGVRAEIAALETRFTGEIAGVQAQIAALDRKFTREIAGLQGQIAGLQGQIAGLQGEIAGLQGEIAGVQAQIAAFETRLLRWVVGTLLAAAAVTVAILRFSL